MHHAGRLTAYIPESGSSEESAWERQAQPMVVEEDGDEHLNEDVDDDTGWTTGGWSDGSSLGDWD